MASIAATNAPFPEGAALIFGATGGLGSAAARALAAEGSGVALGFRSKADKAAALSTELEALGAKVSSHSADVTEPSEIADALAAAIAAHGRVHTLVWAAGPLVSQLLLSETPAESWRRAIDVEVHGFFSAVQSVLPHFREAGGGSIVHIGSAGDMRWPERDGLSVAPKAANEALVRGIAREEGRFNIRANSVLTGVIEAGMFLDLLQQGVFDDAWVTEVQKALSLKRWGQPEDIGNAVVFLASSKAGYITGQQLAVAGGYGV